MALLKANCFPCHNEEKKKGGLRLTSRDLMMKGGDDGQVVVPGKADQSPLAKALLPDADPHMPPKKQLSAGQITLLRAWIDAGAAWDTQALAAVSVVTTLDRLGQLPTDYHPALSVALSSDGKILAAGFGNRIRLYNVGRTNAGMTGELKGLRDAAQSLAWSPDGDRVAAGSFRQIIVWDAKSLKTVARLTNNLAGRVTAMEFTANGKTLVVADGEPSRSGLVHFWNLDSPTPASTFEAHQDTIFALKLSRDGKSLATGGADKLVKLWSLPDHKEKAKFEGHTGHIMALAFNENDTWLASAGADKEIKIWELATRDKIIVLNKQSAGVTGLDWSPDGKRLIAVCEDGSARVFTDFKTHQGGENSDGASMRKLGETDQLLYCVAASSDGNAIYAGAYDGSVFLWESNKKPATLIGTGPEHKVMKPAEKTASAK